MLAVRLPTEIENRLAALAKATGRTKSFYVREAVLEHMDELEGVYLVENRYAAIRAGRTKTVSMKKIMKRYGLED